VTSSPIHSTSLAISWPSAMGRPVMPPMWTNDASFPQIPHAAIWTSASRGPGGFGSGMSSSRTSFGPWMRICFICGCRLPNRVSDRKSRESATGAFSGPVGIGLEQAGHGIAHRGVDQLYAHAQLILPVGGERRRCFIPGSSAELQRTAGAFQGSARLAETLAPEPEVVNVAVLVSNPDRPGDLLDRLEAGIGGRIAHPRRQL
jgi:hypothetical protein